MTKRKTLLIAMGAVLALAALPAHALFIETSYVGDDDGGGVWSHEDNSRITGEQLQATAEFTVSGTELDVLLSNTGDTTTAPADILQGVFFSSGSDVEITPRDPVGLGDGSDFIGDDGDLDTLQGWAYRNDLATGDANPFNDVYGVTHGIANPGFDTFSGDDTFATWEGEDDDQWPSHPPAGSYGIVSGTTDDDPGPPLVGDYVRNSLLFTFNVDQGFDPGSI
ncbi:MAG: XDD4 family exosortase-dependent surface protein, partial [Candidatus Hydrogenedentota bacterium]